MYSNQEYNVLGQHEYYVTDIIQSTNQSKYKKRNYHRLNTKMYQKKFNKKNYFYPTYQQEIKTQNKEYSNLISHDFNTLDSSLLYASDIKPKQAVLKTNYDTYSTVPKYCNQYSSNRTINNDVITMHVFSKSQSLGGKNCFFSDNHQESLYISPAYLISDYPYFYHMNIPYLKHNNIRN